MNFRNLRADEIECRVGQISEKGFTLLLYKDARCDMNILDETGVIWTRRHYECKGNLFCEVGIYDADLKQFVYRSDCGTESNTEKEKGEASDSFKRACVNWGIGRELYTSPFIYIKGNVTKNERTGKVVPTFKSMKVVDIGYSEDGKRITRLVISGDGETIFEHGRTTAQKPTERTETHRTTDEPNTVAKPRETHHSAPMTLEEAWERKTTKGVRYAELPEERLRWIIDNAKNADNVEAARLVLKDREENFEDLMPLDDGDLPF